MRKLLFMAAAAAALLGVAGSGAGAADYPATTGTLTVAATGGAGSRVEGCGFAPGAAVQIKADGVDIAKSTASALGCISATVSVPAGTDTLAATGLNSSGGTLTLTARLTPSSGFAFTGANSGLMVGVALAILAVGGLFVVVTRRRALAG